jgi:transcriptional regulator with XRE-family HTH domain
VTDMQPILDRLIKARKNAGLSQGQVVLMLELAAASSFTGIEAGTSALTLKRFLRLCEIYNIDPTWAITGINPKFDPQVIVDVVSKARIFHEDTEALLELLISAKQ